MQPETTILTSAHEDDRRRWSWLPLASRLHTLGSTSTSCHLPLLPGADRAKADSDKAGRDKADRNQADRQPEVREITLLY